MTNANDYIAENPIVINGQSHHSFVVTKFRRYTKILSLVTILNISSLPDRHCFQETELALAVNIFSMVFKILCYSTKNNYDILW